MWAPRAPAAEIETRQISQSRRGKRSQIGRHGSADEIEEEDDQTRVSQPERKDGGAKCACGEPGKDGSRIGPCEQETTDGREDVEVHREPHEEYLAVLGVRSTLWRNGENAWDPISAWH